MAGDARVGVPAHLLEEPKLINAALRLNVRYRSRLVVLVSRSDGKVDVDLMTCVFCSIIADNAPAHVIFRDDLVIAFLSLEGHPLIVPTRHISTLGDLDCESSARMMQTAAKVASAVRKATGCEGINLVLSDGQAAGQDVFHLHLHVVPRWHGDGVSLTWDTRTAPDSDREASAQALRTQLLMLQLG